MLHFLKNYFKIRSDVCDKCKKGVVMQRLFSQLTKGKKILIVLSFLYEMMAFASLYPYTEDFSMLMLAIFSLPIVLLWSSIWIWGWWMFSKHKHLKSNKIQVRTLTTETPSLKKEKKLKASYTKFWLYLLCSIFLFGLSSYVKPYGDILSAILKSLAVFCSIITCIIWKKMPSSKEKEKEEKKQEKQSHLGILLFCIFFIVGGTFFGKYSAQKMNEYEYSKLETFSDLGITQYQMKESLKKQCETSQHVPEVVRPYFCPCFVQVMVGIFDENERDLMKELKQLLQQNDIKDPEKEGFAFGKKYIDDKLQNDPAIQSKMQQCVDGAIEQVQKNTQGN